MEEEYILEGKRYTASELSAYAKKSKISLPEYISLSGAKKAPKQAQYVLEGKTYNESEIADYAKKSNVSLKEYIELAGVKKKDLSDGTGQPSQEASSTRTDRSRSLSDTERPQDQRDSVGLGGPSNLVLFPFKEDKNRPKSVMYGDGLEQENVLVPLQPLDVKQKKYYRIVADERNSVQKDIKAIEDRNLKLGRSIEEIEKDGTYQYLQNKKKQLDEEFRPAALALKEIKKEAALGTSIVERLISSATEGKYSYLNTETIKLDKEVEDKLIDLYDNAPEEIKQKWYKGALPLEKKEELINAAKTGVFNENYKKLKEENKYFLTNIKDNPNISQEYKVNAYNTLKAKNEAFDAKVASEFAGDILKDNFKATTKSKNLDEAIMGRFKGFFPEQADAISTFLEGMGQVLAKVEVAIPEMILMGGERFNQVIGTSDKDNYTPIEATLDLINDTTNLNFLPSSKIDKGKIVNEDGDFNINLYSIEKSLANTLPFTLKIMSDVKKGRMEGAPQSMISQLINPKYNKGFADNLRVVETAYKATIGDNYRDAKDMGMDDSKAYTYANVLSLAEGVSENIMPDFKYFDSLTGATLKNAFKGNLKSAATKQAVKNVTKDFFKNVALELGEEEFVLAVEDGLKYSLLLNHKNSEFFNLKRQKELLAATVIMSGAIGSVGVPGKFTENKNYIYRELYNNIGNLQDSFNAEINSPLNDEKTKQTFIDAYKFASDVSNAIAKSPENVTADQVDLLVQKNKLEEKKKNIDPAFHPDINEEIAAIDAKIRELSKITTEQQQKPEGKPAPVTEQVTEEVDTRTISEKQAEAESKIKRKDLFIGVGDFSVSLGGSNKESVPISHKEINGIEFVQYANPDTGTVDVIVTGKSDNDYVGFYRIYENGKPTNKWSSKFENQSRNKDDFKTMISGVQEMLPDGHEYTEKTSISTDGLRVWGQQLDKGYELQYDENGNIITNTVAINGDAIVNELGVDVNKGNFENIRITKEQFETVKKALIPYLEKLGLNESNIRFSGQNIPTPGVKATVQIDLPVLKKSSTKTVTEQQQKPEGKNSLSLFQEISEMTSKSQMQEFSKNNPEVAFIHNNIEGIIKGIDGAKVVEC